MDSERFSKAAKYAQEYLAQFGDLPPMVLGFNDETGEEICMVTAWEDERQKDLCCSVVKLAFALHGVNEYHFMSEAWALATPGDEQAGGAWRRFFGAGASLRCPAGSRSSSWSASVIPNPPAGS